MKYFVVLIIVNSSCFGMAPSSCTTYRLSSEQRTRSIHNLIRTHNQKIEGFDQKNWNNKTPCNHYPCYTPGKHDTKKQD